MKLVVSLFVLTVFSISAPAQQRIIINGPPEDQSNVVHPKPNLVDIESKIDNLLNEYMDLDLFSGVVLVTQKGKPIYNKAFGMADVENNIPVNIDTRFDIGSMTKAFTKSIILNLVYEGKLELDDKLGQYLKGFSEIPSKQVTIGHLLNHNSGFGDYHTPEYMKLPAEQKTISAILDIARKQGLLFTPGEGDMYSNIGYVLLGAIIQEVTGKPYNKVVEERILKPLKLNNTFLNKKYSIPNRAIGYETGITGELKNSDYLQLNPTPAGSFMSTATDMLKFFRAYYYGEKLWKEGAKKLERDYKFLKRLQSNGDAAMIAGGFAGVNSVSLVVLRDEISIIVLANRNPPAAIEVGNGILEIIRGNEPMQPIKPIAPVIAKAYFENGADYVKKNFDEFTRGTGMMQPKEDLLNEIGYALLQSGNREDLTNAITIFKLNTELFPNVANTWDSYGEALLKSGNNDGALRAYEKALEINPNIPSAMKMIKELKRN
ncbi:MAG TPA: serine hydrolase [Gillisia sp.]|nr:serine hydrolase [Gillisia sp.]